VGGNSTLGGPEQLLIFIAPLIETCHEEAEVVVAEDLVAAEDLAAAEVVAVDSVI
jgi:hypothetical protein